MRPVAARVPRDDGEPEGEVLRADEQLVVQLVPMRRRHLRAVLRIEAQVYPRPWSLSLFMSELALRATRAYYVETNEDALVMWAKDIDTDAYERRLAGIESTLSGSTIFDEPRS